jgi:hypothetical protein
MDSKPSDGKWTKNVQLPTAPPYLLYMGNMDFNVTERDLQIFFGDLEIKNIRIIKDANDNPKGFGYVEFEDLKGLKDALLLNNESLMGRNVRLDVAEQSSERRGFRTDRTTESTNWRRDGPPPSVDREGRERKYDKTENVSNWRRDGPPPEIQGRERKYDTTQGVSNWRRDGPPPEIQGRERNYDKTENLSNWRRDGPPPDREGRELADRKSFRNVKADNESNWRRDGPVPELKKERQGPPSYGKDGKDGSRLRSSERERHVVQDRVEKVSTWRREAPLEEKNVEMNEKRLNRSEKPVRTENVNPKTKADSVDSWRSSGAPKTLATGFKGLKHEGSNTSIKLAKASRTEDKTESTRDGNAPKASVRVNNAFGCLSNED